MEIKSGRDSNTQFGDMTKMIIDNRGNKNENLLKKIIVGIFIAVAGAIAFYFIQPHL